MAITTIPSLPQFADAVMFEAYLNACVANAALLNWAEWLLVSTTDERVTRKTGYTGAPAYVARVNHGLDVDAEALAEEDSVAFEQLNYEAGVEVARDTLRYLEGKIGALAAQLSYDMGAQAMYAIQELASAVLSGGFSGTGFSGGKSLFATDHPTAVTTVPNKITSALSYTTLGTMRQYATQTRTANGARTPWVPAYLHVPSALVPAALQIVTSAVESSNMQTNVVNMTMPGLKIVEHVSFTDADNWFVSGRNWRAHALFGVGPAPYAYRREGSENLRVQDHFHCSMGAAAWQGACGSAV